MPYTVYDIRYGVQCLFSKYRNFQPEWTFKNLAKLSSRLFSSNPRIGFINSGLSFISWSNYRWSGDTHRWNWIWQIWNLWQILWEAKILAWFWINLCHTFFCIYFYRKSVWKLTLNSQGGLPVQVWDLWNRGSGLDKVKNTKRTPILQPTSYTRLCCNGVLHSFYCNFPNWMGFNTSFTSFDYSKPDLQRKRAYKIKFISIWFHRKGLMPNNTSPSGDLQTTLDALELFGFYPNESLILRSSLCNSFWFTEIVWIWWSRLWWC